MTRSLVGHILAAGPLNPRDNLDHSVILVVKHDHTKSFGLQLNRPIADFTLRDVGDQMDIFLDCDDSIYYGGSIGASKIHVIHTNDWSGLTTVRVTDQLSVTNDTSVLEAISRGDGPAQFKACAGIWGWDAGKLDAQVDARPEDTVRYRWESVVATPELVFNTDSFLDQWHSAVEASARQQASSWL